jgi:hypothetical protein
MVLKSGVVMIGAAVAATLAIAVPAIADHGAHGHDDMLLSQTDMGGEEMIVRGEVLETIGNRIRVRDLDRGEEVFYNMTEQQQIDAGVYESMLIRLVVVGDDVVAATELNEEEAVVTESEVTEESVVETTVVQEEAVVETTIIEEEEAAVEPTPVAPATTPQPAPVPALW